MLKIRLQRVGRRHEPSFRLVLTDSLNATKSGKFNEILGSYDPRKSEDKLNSERINYWLSNGAMPTDTVHNLLVRHGIVKGKKRDVSAVSKKAPVEAPTEEKSTEESVTSDVSPAEDVTTSTLADSEVEAPDKTSE